MAPVLTGSGAICVLGRNNMAEQDIRRSLVAHAPLRRRPHTMLPRMLDRVAPDTPLYGPDAPVDRA